jgi:S1-C subfamily serine protease
MLVLPGLLSAADRPAAPESFARVAAAARAASIVIRRPETSAVLSVPAGEDPDLAPLHEESELFDALALLEEQTLAVGVIVDPRGFALTSARPMRLAPSFEVALHDGTPVKAVLLALDSRSDVAVLKLEAGGVPMPYLPLGDSDRIAVGEWVIAVGAPLGLEGSVTAGVVTATPTPASSSPLAGFLQTDATMGAGYAGAPLVNLAGQIVGLGTLIAGDGISYALPSTAVRRVYRDLLEKGRVSRPWLGAATQTLGVELASALGASGSAGVVVVDAHPHGPAAGAGLRSGDIVVAIDATPVSSRTQFERAIGAREPGHVVTLGVRRAARELTVRVKLGEESGEWPLPPTLARARRLLGLDVRPMTPTFGVRAARVEPAGPAARAGIESGDVIREVNRRPVRTMAEFETAVRSIDPRSSVPVLVQRGDVALYVGLAPRP